MKSILLIGSERGGVGRFIQNMKKGLEKLGVNSDVFYLDHFPLRKRNFENISLSRVKAPLFALNTFSFASKLANLRNKYDVIHTNYAIPSLLAYFSRTTKRRLIYTMHGPPRPWIENNLLDKVYYGMELAVAKCVAKNTVTVTNSNYSRLMNLKLLGVDCKVVYNGVDTSFFTPATDVFTERDKLKLPRDAFIVLYIGRYISLKRPQNVLKALLTFEPGFVKRNKIHVVCIGKGPLLDELLKLSEGFAGKVQFISNLTNIELRHYYRSSNILVMPSIGEPFGYTTLEAMSCGLPVIADSSGSNPEILGECGLYYESDNYFDLSKKLRQSIEEKDLLSNLSQRARNRAEKFDYINMTKEYLNIYNTT